MIQEPTRRIASGDLPGGGPGIAHDINNLLSSVIGNCDLLMPRLVDDEEARRILGEVVWASERACRLTRAMFLEVSGAPSPPLDVNELLAGLAPALEGLAGGSVRVVCELDPDAAAVSMDREALERVVINLVLNARDAMPRGGRILLRTTATDPGLRSSSPPGSGGVRLSVLDEGEGMNPETLERIFEPGFTTRATGTGIGLALVRETVEEAGGVLDVESAPGRGSAFHLLLPGVA